MQSQPREAIRIASKNGILDAVKLLVEHFPSHLNTVDSEGRTPMYHVAKEGHVDVAEFFAKLPNIDASTAEDSGWTPMHAAVKGGLLFTFVFDILCHRSSICDFLIRNNT